MIDLIQKLLFGHVHHWVERSSHSVIGSDSRFAEKIVVVSRCSICGRMKNNYITG